MSQTTIQSEPSITTEQKIEQLKTITRKKDQADKLLANATGVEGFAITLKDITIYSDALPMHVVASIKTILADCAQTSRQQLIEEASEVIKA